MQVLKFFLLLPVRIVLLPVVFALWLIFQILKLCLYASSIFTGIAAFILAVLGTLVLISTSIKNGIIVYAIAALVFALPIAGAWLSVGVLYIKDFIWDLVYC